MSTDQDVTLRLKLENQAAAGFAAVKKDMEGLTSTLKQSFITTAQGKKGMVELDTEMKKLADTANFLRNEVDNITDQLKLFGEQGLQAANALEEIADPTRRIAEGQRLLAAAIRGTRSEMTQLQDSAKVRIAENNLNDLTDTLNRLSPAGQRAAARLAEVTDVQRRNAAAAQIMKAELAEKGGGGVVGAFRRLDDNMAISQAKFAALPTSMQALAKGAVPALATSLGGLAAGGGLISGALGDMAGSMVHAAGAAGSMALGVAAAGLAIGAGLAAAVGAASLAVGKFALDGLAEWRKQSLAAQAANDNLERSTRGLKLAVGELVEDVLQTTLLEQGLAKITRDAAEAMDGLTLAQKANAKETQAERIARESGNRQLTNSIFLVGPLIGIYDELSGALVEVGVEEQKRLKDLKAFSATTDIVTATITRMNDELAKTVDTSSDATKAMTTGMEGALSRAADLEEQIRRINEAWDDNTALDRGVAVGKITEAAPAALTRKSGGTGDELERLNALQREVDRERQNSYLQEEHRLSLIDRQIDRQMFQADLLRQQIELEKELRGAAGNPERISNAQKGAASFQTLAGQSVKGGITQEEMQALKEQYTAAQVQIFDALSNTALTGDEVNLLSGMSDELDLLMAKLREMGTINPWRQIGGQSLDIVNSKLQETGLIAAETLGMFAVGEGTMENFGKAMVEQVQDLLKTLAPAFVQLGVSLLAVQTGNAVGLILAGTALAALAGTLSKFTASKSPGSSQGGAGTDRLREIADIFRSQNTEEREGRTVNIFVDGDQIQGTIERGVLRGAQRGVFGVPQPAGFFR